MWVDAFQWDCTNSFRINHKLTDEHIFPNNAQKMRNKFAFETLDSEMLNLMTCYSQTLNATRQAEMAKCSPISKVHKLHCVFVYRFKTYQRHP